MVDDISRVGTSQSQQANQAVKPRQGANSGPGVSDSTESSSAAPRAVEVELSREIQRSEERAEFDAVRVRELKDQIERGTYPIDTEKLAEKFADLEQLL